MTSRADSGNAEPDRRQSETESLSTPPSISQPAGTKRKRLQDSEAEAETDELKDVRPFKQPPALFPSQVFQESLPNDPEAEPEAEAEPEPEADEQEIPPSKYQLTKQNLRRLNKMYDSNTRLDSTTGTSSYRSIFTSSAADTSRSQRSSSTTAHYRYKHLRGANVYIHVDPPEEIQAAIDDIVNAESSESRCAFLRDKAKMFWKKCKQMVQASHGEDDFVQLFHRIAEDISPDKLAFRKTADWREDLKPRIWQSNPNLTCLPQFRAFGGDEQQDSDGAPIPPPPKRLQQSGGYQYISPQSSHPVSLDSAPDKGPPTSNTMPPPASLPNKTTSPIKTPRPDITVGIEESAFISALTSALSSQNFNYDETAEFLNTLQNSTMLCERDKAQESALIIVPTQRDSELTFPSLVFEGKGYSTGKQVFEAENQAAVAGACGLKIQLVLDELVKCAIGKPDALPISSKDQPQLFFSVCSEGPYHELWAHYIIVENGRHKFKMVLLDACNATILKQVEKFIIEVDNIMIWTVGPFLKSIVERLKTVAEKASV